MADGRGYSPRPFHIFFIVLTRFGHTPDAILNLTQAQPGRLRENDQEGKKENVYF